MKDTEELTLKLQAELNTRNAKNTCSYQCLDGGCGGGSGIGAALQFFYTFLVKFASLGMGK